MPAPAGGLSHRASAALQQWRLQLLDHLLRAGLLAGALQVAMSVAVGLNMGDWRHLWAASGVLGGVCLLKLARPLGYRLRALGVLAVFYGTGVWLLTHLGAMMLAWLLATPILAMLLLGRRGALAVLALCTCSLVGVGVGLELSLPMVRGISKLPLLRWINLGVGFTGLGLVVMLSCEFVLRRLRSALTEQLAVTDTLRGREEMLRQIAGQVPGMLFRLRFDAAGQLHYDYASAGAQTLFGLAPEQLMADGWRIHRLVVDEDREPLMRALTSAHLEGQALAAEFRVRLDDGREKWLAAQSTEVARDAQGVVHTGIMVDITERKASEALVWQQAHFDALTGLPNRRLMRDRLEQGLIRSLRSQLPLVLMLIDLDHFKTVNDTLGHDSGDQLLVEATRRIRACVRETDTLARMGGDEFTVVLPELAGGAVQAEAIAARIIAALSQAFTLAGEEVYISASIGIARCPDDGVGIDNLLQHADQALYAAKDAGRNRFHHFTRTLQDDAQLRMRLAADLRQALQQQQLSVVYQPIVHLASGQVHKAEALLRWQHPERGAISPAVFVPIAEATGLIGEIGEWVFRTAADQAQHWRATLHARFQISVNRSPLQFRGPAGPRGTWAEQLARRGLAGDAIAVEITEGLLLDTGAEVSTQLLALRDAGIPVSLDDFGTGYSSMAYLQKFHIDYLKIDRSFVSGLTDGSHQGDTGRALCKAMIVMAHELGMQVIAEGVETDEQRLWLQAAGCDYAQGWLFAKPMTVEVFEAFAGRHRRSAANLPALATTALPATAQRCAA
ncbi:putative bifunctional diguanylate cyclase/phosphodiesterase [Aquabacterium sp. OR-4]|uniref:putative bifunctional diguanylate cyclase/phosphodiesterase n=1 Tax=Aquabacterium sp. OR-4 TaxID=2978127 RepID=UPI0021B3F95D|nr:EAL domain-containing protein [Aquabacterium sp. OR-4]MDT7837793.1 EAL domain-containing protein [Aquabacterium sp. OR-4]